VNNLTVRADSKSFNLTLLFLITVSMFGLLLSIVFVVNPPKLADDFALRKTAVGSVFGAVCILGILGGLHPHSCSRILDFEKQDRNTPASSKSHGQAFQGHHPDCGSFSSHVLRIGENRFCATCSGLVFGAIITLFGTGAFFFGNVGMTEGLPLLASVGAVEVTLGLLHPTALRLKSYARFLAGTLFVVGTFLVLVSIEDAARSTLIDLFFVALSMLWILTKVSLSKWEHERICSQCPLESCNATRANKISN
jgi:hypothetical protein